MKRWLGQWWWAVLIGLFAVGLMGGAAFGDDIKLHENQYTKKIISQWGLTPRSGQVVLPDDRRVDILTVTHAWEVDWHNKWAEAVGQSLGYAIATDRKPGIVLLYMARDKAAAKLNYNRCAAVCSKYGIRLRMINVRTLHDPLDKPLGPNGGRIIPLPTPDGKPQNFDPLDRLDSPRPQKRANPR